MMDPKHHIENDDEEQTSLLAPVVTMLIGIGLAIIIGYLCFTQVYENLVSDEYVDYGPLREVDFEVDGWTPIYVIFVIGLIPLSILIDPFNWFHSDT